MTKVSSESARRMALHTSATLRDSMALEGSSSLASPLRRSKRLTSTIKPNYAVEDGDETESTSKKTSVIIQTSATTTWVKSEDFEPGSSGPNPAKRRRTATPKKPKLIPRSLAVPHPAPLRWREVYDRIVAMRSKVIAPVDTMGCARAQLDETEPKNQRFATLVSLMLSSQTKDEVTSAAVSNLREALGGSVSVDAVISVEECVISEAICKVGFWRRKSLYIKQAAQMLRDKFDSDVPKTVDELCSLPGVGPKMAFLALQVAWNVNAGIGVDVHVHRITNRLGWHTPPTKMPEETRLNLQSWLPEELHADINPLLVGFGQTICLPTAPRCGNCTLSSDSCPSAREGKTKSMKAVAKASLDSSPQVEIKLEEEANPSGPVGKLPSGLLQIKDEEC